MHKYRPIARGFSLIELVVVLAIAGVLATLSTSYMIAAKPHADLERGEMELVAHLNAARHQAITEETPTRVKFDTTVTPHQYWVEKYDSASSSWVASGLPLYELPSGVRLYTNTFSSSTVQFNTRGGLLAGGALTLKSSAGETATFTGNLADGRFFYGAGNTR